MDVGTYIQIINPDSLFMLRQGIITRFNPDSGQMLVRLFPEDDGPTLPCHVSDVKLALEEAIDEQPIVLRNPFPKEVDPFPEEI